MARLQGYLRGELQYFLRLAQHKTRCNIPDAGLGPNLLWGSPLVRHHSPTDRSSLLYFTLFAPPNIFVSFLS